jgi:hypothetical protein
MWAAHNIARSRVSDALNFAHYVRLARVGPADIGV